MSSEKKQVAVRNSAGKEVSKRDVSADMFTDKVHEGLLHQAVRWQRAGKRAGTHAVLTRGQASGGGVKPWKQKGTGRARAGSNTSPLWVGGGIAHGPKVRKYDFGMNKKQLRLALQSAITARLQEERLSVIEDFGVKEGKTKEAQKTLAALGIPARSKVLVVVPAEEKLTWRSLRNIEGVKVCTPAALNVYDVLAARQLLFTAEGLKAVETRMGA